MVFGNIFLCAVTGYGLSQIHKTRTWTAIGFAGLFAYGALNLLQSIAADCIKMEESLGLLASCAQILPLPLINMELYLRSSAREIVGFLHGIPAIVFLCMTLVDPSNRSAHELLEVTMLFNVLSTGIFYFKYTDDDIWVVVLGMVGAIHQYSMREICQRLNIERDDCFPFGCAILALVGLKALHEGFG